MCGDPTDLDRNLTERGRSRSEGPDVVINIAEHELARRSLRVLHRLDSGLAVGENHCLSGSLAFWPIGEVGNRHFNAVELGNVHC